MQEISFVKPGNFFLQKFEKCQNVIFEPMYRVGHKFSDTWNELFVVNWFISKFFWGNTKWKKVSFPHYLKNLMKLSKHGISYSLKCNPRSISEITFWANLSVSPIDIELYFFKELAKLKKNCSTKPSNWSHSGQGIVDLNKKLLKKYQSSVALSIGLTLKLA